MKRKLPTQSNSGETSESSQEKAKARKLFKPFLILGLCLLMSLQIKAQEYPFSLPAVVTAELNVNTGNTETFNNLLLGYNIFHYSSTEDQNFIRTMDPITIRFPDGLYSNWYDWRTDQLRVFGTETVTYIHRNAGTRTVPIDKLTVIQDMADREVKIGIDGLQTLNTQKNASQGKGYDMLWTFNMSADGINFNNGSPESVARYYDLKSRGLEVKAIEMGNENFYPGQRSSIIPNAREYILRAKSMSQALKAKDPAIKVSIPLLRTGSWVNPTWNTDLTQDLSYFDAITVHTYVGHNPDNPASSDNAYSSALIARKILADANNYARSYAPNKPIWLSEWGVQVNGPNAASILGMADCYLYMAENQDIYERANWFSVNGRLNSFLIWETYIDAKGKERPRIKEPKQKTAYASTYEIIRSVFEGSTMLAGTVNTTQLEQGVKAVNAKAVVKDGETMVFAINMTNKPVVFTLRFNGSNYNGSFKHETMKFTSLSQQRNMALSANPLTIEKQGTGTITLPPLSVNKISGISISTPPANGQSPYTWAVGIPGTIEAENYDKGGEGVAYHDKSPGNTGGVYRQDDVDIQANDTGYHIAWTETGEWLEYRINVASTGNYNFTFTYATPNSTAVLGASFPDENITLFTGCTMPTTGNWTNFETRTRFGVPLTAGYHILRLNIESGGINIDKIEITEPFKSSSVSAPNLGEVSNDELGVYPNPSSNGLFHLNNETSWVVYSMDGRELSKGEGSLVNLSAFPAGTYFLKSANKVLKLLKNQ